MDKSAQKKGYLQVFTAGCLWGTIGLFVTVLSGMGADGALISLLRILTACIMMFIIVLFRCGGIRAFRISRQVLILTLLMGLFCQAIYNLCYSKAIQITGVATAAVLLYTAPIFVFIMAVLFFKESITSRKLLALGINILGCALTVTGGHFSSLSFEKMGIVMGLLAGFFYGLSTVFSKMVANKAHPYVITFYSFLFASVFLFIFNPPWTLSDGVLDLPMLLVGVAYGFVATVLAYAVYMTGLAKPVETSRVPVIASVETVVAAFLGALVFSESMGLWKILGIGLVFCSIVVMNLPSRPTIKKSGT
ncbi:MAG: DMT family transporter [Eubacteriales bacterium]|nr:DMT family transporter [Eubacteriales bacterium]